MAVLEVLKEIEAKAQEGQVGIADELLAKYDEGYGKGFADGKASVVLPDPTNPDKLYTQADMDKVAAQAKADQVTADQAAADQAAAELKAAQDELAALKQDVGAKIHDGIAAFKAQELEKLKGLEADFVE
jgi:hypothetical protein